MNDSQIFINIFLEQKIHIFIHQDTFIGFFNISVSFSLQADATKIHQQTYRLMC